MTPSRVVHLELHTHDLSAASAFYGELLQWRCEEIVSPWGSYRALLLGDGLDGGIVECGTPTAGWLPVRRGRAGGCRRPTAPGGSARRCCSARARDRRVGGRSCGRRPAARSRSGGRSDERRGAHLRRALEPHRRELQAHCYRMLGSVQDAEDAVQETLLKAWRGLERFEGRSSLRSWLYAIATNVCLRVIERRPARVLPIDYGPAADPRRRWDRRWPSRLDRAVSRRRARPRRGRRRRPATSSARRSSSPSSPRCSACPPAACRAGPPRRARGSRARRSPRSWRRRRPRCTACSSARTRARSTSRLPERSQQATLRSLGNERLERDRQPLRRGVVAQRR